MEAILALNSGSSSIKFQLLAMPDEQRLLAGLLEGIGNPDARLHVAHGNHAPNTHSLAAPDHAAGLAAIFALLTETGGTAYNDSLAAIGHRVVHGGGAFFAPVVLDTGVITQLEAASTLAPLHNASNIEGIRIAHDLMPAVPQVAVFDTAYHHDLPDPARLYALPLELQRQHHIRRYGFHGLSHEYVASVAAERLGRPLTELRLITLHLGNGASACAIRGGRSVDTSMGFTPLEGLVMGSRCGDLDPALPGHLENALGLSGEEVEHLLNRQSGLVGLCGDSDMRRIEARMAGGDPAARLAFELFVYRVRKAIGAYFAVLNGLDALVFTAGIGEHSATVRAAVCRELDALGIALDPVRNAAAAGTAEISPPGSAVRVWVIPTDEERQIARATHACLQAVTTV